eukprot:scaffold66995_cov35-Prasinocladus_malaysianus.AAC.1
MKASGSLGWQRGPAVRPGLRCVCRALLVAQAIDEKRDLWVPSEALLASNLQQVDMLAPAVGVVRLRPGSNAARRVAKAHLHR